MFGSDFWKIFKLALGIFRLITEIFGNGEEQKEFDDIIANGSKPAKK